MCVRQAQRPSGAMRATRDGEIGTGTSPPAEVGDVSRPGLVRRHVHTLTIRFSPATPNLRISAWV